MRYALRECREVLQEMEVQFFFGKFIQVSQSHLVRGKGTLEHQVEIGVQLRHLLQQRLLAGRADAQYLRVLYRPDGKLRNAAVGKGHEIRDPPVFQRKVEDLFRTILAQVTELHTAFHDEEFFKAPLAFREEQFFFGVGPVIKEGFQQTGFVCREGNEFPDMRA